MSENAYVVFANKPKLLRDERLKNSFIICLDDNEFLCTNDISIYVEILEMGYEEYDVDVK